MDGVMFFVTIAVAIGSGVVGGAFFAFSAFVMKALARLPAAQGIAAMQSINVAAVSPALMSVLFGTALGALAIGARAVTRWGSASAGFALAGSILYLIGVIGVTMLANVPRNNALAGVDPSSATGAAQWAGYVPRWTVWNSVRSAAAVAAAAALLAALLAEHSW